MIESIGRSLTLSHIIVHVIFRSSLFSCMSQKAELPSLTGHRTKTRKRDEKKVRRTMMYVFSHYDYLEYLHEYLEIFEYFHEYL